MSTRITAAWLGVACCLITNNQATIAQGIAANTDIVRLNGELDRWQLVLTRKDAGDNRDVTRACSYAVKPASLATIDSNGRITPLANGKGIIAATAAGQSVEIPVRIAGVNSSPPGFSLDVVPVLTKTGCNSGACHASQFGKANFKLSLFGYAPEQDHPQLARDYQQRRISLVHPEDSLILQKATLQVGHGGGKRVVEDSYEYRVLKQWLAQGAPGPLKNEPTVVDLTVTPPSSVYKAGDQHQLSVLATLSDGTVRDVTHRALYDSMGTGVAEIDRNGLVDVVGAGQAAIMIRYQGQAKISLVQVPFDREIELAGFEPNNFVDELVRDHWSKLKLQPAELCNDGQFIRRAFLDAIGTLPTSKQIEQFVSSEYPDKRNRLIDELLGLTGDSSRDVFVNQWSAYWALKWGDLLRNNRNVVGDGGMWAFHNWLRQSFRENKPFDEFVREIITAQGSIYANGPANYYKIATRAEDLAETTAQVFLGVRMQCARCHHHPFEVYSQSDYYGLAAFFTRVGTKSSSDFGALGRDTVVMLRKSGSIRHPRTRQVMEPAPLLKKPVDMKGVRDFRQPLADWLTSADNTLFAKNIVNRTWGYFMGTGLVEPIDDLRATNPASIPPLLDALAARFVESGYDLRELMRTIMTSRVYQLRSTPRAENVADTRFYLHYNVKRLSAEVLLDAIDDACGTQERFSGVPLGTRAIELPDSNYASYFLDTLGRPKRVIACECERTSEPNLAGVLHLANGDVVQKKLSDKNGRIAAMFKNKTATPEIVKTLYQLTFSRNPTPDELSGAVGLVESSKDQQQAMEDILWALLNSREFLFNH